MIKIEFPADRLDLAKVFGDALLELAGAPAETPKQPSSEPESLFDGGASGTVGGADNLGADPQTTPPAGSLAAAVEGTRLDHNGVAFDPQFCGTAKDPFYKTGPNKGQWKKRQGVDQAAYDAWYAAKLEGFASDTVANSPAPVNPGAAFGAAPTQPAPADPPPTDAGSLMGWISEKQAAGLLSQHDVNEAYEVTGVTTGTLFGENAPSNVAAVHTFLNAKLSAA